MVRAPWVVGSILAAALIAGPTAAYATTGHGHTPVTICHNGNTLTVDDNALKGHLKHGDKEGPCQSTPTTPPTVSPPVTPPTIPPTLPTPGPSTPGPTTHPVETVTPKPELPVETPQPTEPTDSGPTTAPEPSPSTPPTIRPEIQDYITCLGGAFVLDNTSSTETVVYTINGTSIPVPKGQAFHTDAEGAPLFQPLEIGYTITAADRTWVFPSAGNCPVVTPPTDNPPTPEPTEEVTPSPSTPVTPVPTISPTPTRSPSPMPEIPNSGGDKPTSVTPGVSSPPTVTPATSTTTDPPTVTSDTVSSKSLAMTGTDEQRLTAGIIFGAFLLLAGGTALWYNKKNK